MRYESQFFVFPLCMHGNPKSQRWARIPTFAIPGQVPNQNTRVDAESDSKVSCDQGRGSLIPPTVTMDIPSDPSGYDLPGSVQVIPVFDSSTPIHMSKLSNRGHFRSITTLEDSMALSGLATQ